MRVLHVISGLSRKSGGPARSSQGLVAALCKAGVDAWIWALDGTEPWIEGVRDARKGLGSREVGIREEGVDSRGERVESREWGAGSAAENGGGFVDLEPGDTFDQVEQYLKKQVSRRFENKTLDIVATIGSNRNAGELAKHTAKGESEEAHKFAAKNVGKLFERGTVAFSHLDKKAVAGQRWVTRFIRVISPFVFSGDKLLATITLKAEATGGKLYSVESVEINQDAKFRSTPRGAMSKDLNSAPILNLASQLKEMVTYYVGDVNRTHPAFVGRSDAFTIDHAADLILQSVNPNTQHPTPYSLLSTLSSPLPSFDLVHIHGIWSWKLHQVCVACRKAGVPYVVAPRGMLEPWSLKQKWLKKRVARWLYQDKDLKCAAALHATAESEAEQFRKLGFKNEIIVSPNGVNVPVGTFKVKVKGEGEQRRALFVSRMHPKKGVMELVEAFAKVKDKGEGERWCVELVYTVSGETEREYEQKVLRRVQELGLTFTHHCPPPPHTSTSQSPDIIFTGALDDEKKWEAYARADLFVLPTHSENFGIVVAEALWAGVPVITTKGTPWGEIGIRKEELGKRKEERGKRKEERGIRKEEVGKRGVEVGRCGWWIDLPEKGTDPADWKALQDALKEAMTSAPLGEMGRRGHELVEQKYTWGAVVKAVVDGYRCVV